MRMIAFFLTVLISQFSYANEPEIQANLFTKQITPCESWTYNADVRAYVCRSSPWRIEVVEARDLVRVLNDMQRKLNDLERRIQVLEAN